MQAEKKKAHEESRKDEETVFSHRSRQCFLSFSLLRFFDPSTESCREFQNCHGNPAAEELAWDCGPCSVFLLDGGNGHCDRVPGCSLSGGGSGGAAAATVLASSGRGGQQQRASAAAAAQASSEQRQIAEIANRNAVVYNLQGKGSVSVGMPPTGARRAAAAAGASSSSSAAAAASAPSSSRGPSSSSSPRSPSPPAVDPAASASDAAAARS